MKKLLILSGLLISLCASVGVFAQSNPEMKSMVDDLVAQMKYQLEAQTKLLSDPKILEAQATQQYLYYQALIKAGFSKEQAMQLLVAKPQPSKS